MSIDVSKAREIFIEAVGKAPPKQWEALLSDRCGEDAELCRHVRHLLQAHVEAGSFLESPALNPILTAEESPASECPGTGQ
jgi:hypothetical protein